MIPLLGFGEELVALVVAQGLVRLASQLGSQLGVALRRSWRRARRDCRLSFALVRGPCGLGLANNGRHRPGVQ